MKKLIQGIALSLTTVFLLTACGSGTKAPQVPSTNVKTTSADQAPVTLTYSMWDIAQQPSLEFLAQQFTEKNPNIKIEFSVKDYDNYWTTLETAASAQTAPDIFWMNIPRSYDYISNDILLPLDDLNIDASAYPEALWKAFEKDGHVYGIPKDFDTIGLVYNKTLFDAAGVGYPTEEWTWEDLRNAAEKLTNKEAGVYGIAAPPHWQKNYFPLIYQNDSTPFTVEGKSNFSDPKVVAALEYWYGFTQDGFSPDNASFENVSAVQLMQTGKAAMSFDGSWQVALYNEDDYTKNSLDYAMLPKQARHATVANSLANVVYSKGKNIDAAKKFVAFLSTQEANDYIAENSMVMPAYKASQEKWYARFPNQNAQVFVDTVKDAFPLPTVPNFSAAEAISKEVLAKAWAGEISIKEACEQITKDQDDVLPGYTK